MANTLGQLDIKHNYQAFIALPRWSVFKVTGSLSLLFLILFYCCYGLTDYITHQHTYRINIHFNWELQTPFLPWMSLIYASISPLLMLAPLVIRDIEEFKLMFKVMVAETLIACLFFIFLPIKNVYPEPLVTGLFSDIYYWLDLINLTYNELPSLHVTFAFTTAYFFSRNLSPLGKVLLFSWALLLAFSTLLTHQHYLASVLSAIILSGLVIFYYLRVPINVNSSQAQ